VIFQLREKPVATAIRFTSFVSGWKRFRAATASPGIERARREIYRTLQRGGIAGLTLISST
jgi:hypothetical protein